MSTLAVVEDVLRRARIPLTAQQIVTRARGRLPTTAKRPDLGAQLHPRGSLR